SSRCSIRFGKCIITTRANEPGAERHRKRAGGPKGPPGVTGLSVDPRGVINMKHVLNSVPAAVLLAFLASASGCVQVQSRPYIGVEAFSPTAPDTVQILRMAPSRPN